MRRKTELNNDLIARIEKFDAILQDKMRRKLARKKGIQHVPPEQQYAVDLEKLKNLSLKPNVPAT